MSLTSQSILTCNKCGHSLEPHALACEYCHQLVHAEELERLSSEAKALEAKGELRQARERWLAGIPLLPAQSTQAEWIHEHARALDVAAYPKASAPPSENKWVKKLGPLGPVALLLAKGKSLLAVVFKAKFLFSFLAFIGIYWQLYGPQFGIGFAVLILIHELGHFIDIKRRGLPAEMPVFLPGLGAYVKWQAMGVSLETRAAISLAGPFAGWIASGICAMIWWQTRDGIWAALARSSAWLNVLNLIPIWMLDGGQAASALSKAQRLLLLTACVALWFFLGEKIFLLVALGATWRFFTKDAPPQPSSFIMIYFVAVLALLGCVMYVLPGQGFGTQ